MNKIVDTVAQAIPSYWLGKALAQRINMPSGDPLIQPQDIEDQRQINNLQSEAERAKKQNAPHISQNDYEQIQKIYQQQADRQNGEAQVNKDMGANAIMGTLGSIAMLAAPSMAHNIVKGAYWVPSAHAAINAINSKVPDFMTKVLSRDFKI